MGRGSSRSRPVPGLPSSHYKGVKCKDCKRVLDEDNCCPDNPHGYIEQERTLWAQYRYPYHQCYGGMA